MKPFYRIPKGTSILVRDSACAPARRVTTRRDIDLQRLPNPIGRQYEIVVEGFYITVPQTSVVKIDPQRRLFD